MAIAGKVAIVPKGAWNSTTNYEKLNAVTYNNKLFIAKKASIGVEPEDGDTWMFGVQSLDQEQFDELSSELDELSSALDQLENDKADKSEVCVNLIDPTSKSVIVNGVTCINNEDGTYTLDGTATSDARFYISLAKDRFLDKKDCTLKFIGCPPGGSTSSFYLQLDTKAYSKVDTGKGFLYFDNSSYTIVISIRVASGTTVSNLIFKPMLTTDLTATYDDFVPYTGDGGRLNEDVVELRKNKADKRDVCVNLFNPSLKGETTTYGVTCTANGDGTYTLNGTATGTINFNLILSADESIPLTSTKYKILGTKGAASDKFFLRAVFLDSSLKEVIQRYVYDDGHIVNSSVGYPYLKLILHVESGATLSNVVVKPMVTTDLEATYDDYVPYTGDSERLNEDVAELRNQMDTLKLQLICETDSSGEATFSVPNVAVTDVVKVAVVGNKAATYEMVEVVDEGVFVTIHSSLTSKSVFIIVIVSQ